MQVSNEEKALAVLCHVFYFIGFPIIGPAIVWLIKRQDSPFMNSQGLEAINFQLTMIVVSVIVVALSIVFTGGANLGPMIPMVLLTIYVFIMTLYAIVSVISGRDFRYPFIFRLVR